MLLFIASEWGYLIAQLMLSLSILVVVHEFGHFITAKWFGCRVDKFYLFFDWKFSLFKKQIGETEYGIGWLPLGGYVKIAGMVDESMDTQQLEKPAEKWEFRSKPAWQRLIIMLGGVIMNVITAFIIYMAICMVWGIKSVPNSSLKYGIAIQDSLMYDIGFKNGDKIISVNEKPVEDFLKLPMQLILGDHVEIERDGKKETITLPENLIGQLVEKKRNRVPLASVRVEPILLHVADSSNAQLAGLQIGDKITAIDSTPVQFFDELKALVQPRKNDTVRVSFIRNGASYTQPILVNAEGQLGVMAAYTAQQFDSLGFAKLDTTIYGFGASIPAAASLAKEKISNQLSQLKKIFTPKTGGYKAVGGFKSMASIFNPYEWNWEDFWTMTAILSILLAVMNLLPIPALDGGHVVFTLIEMITGKKPNQKVLEYAQVAGMIILLALMLYANLNDFFGWGKGR